jgi:hypothetical protein
MIRSAGERRMSILDDAWSSGRDQRVIAPAGWYPDTHGVHRWWDGYRWTDAVQPAVSVPAPHQHVAPGTPTSTIWIWLAVVTQAAMFVFAIVAFVHVQPQMQVFLSAAFSRSADSTATVLQREATVFADPWYVGNLIVPFVASGVAVWFAALDRRSLEQRGFDRPFHWAWSLIGLQMYACALVYAIGRTVVIRRRGGRGTAPMIAAIAIQAAGIAMAIAFSASWMLQVLHAR